MKTPRRGARNVRSKSARQHKRSKREVAGTIQRGVCQACGCTSTTACWHDEQGPCAWANQEQTLCTHCLHMLPDVERFNDFPTAMRVGADPDP